MTGPIAVIGAGGFVGKRLVESLVVDGVPEIRAVVRAYRSLAGLSRFGEAVTVRLADAADAGALAQVLRGCSIAVNLTTGVPAQILPTTKAIWDACLQVKVARLIHLSSAVVYGDVATPPADDDAPPVSRHWMPYAQAKAAAEVWLKSHFAAGSCQLAVLRPGIIWGAGSPHTLSAVTALLEKRAYLVDGGSGIFNS